MEAQEVVCCPIKLINYYLSKHTWRNRICKCHFRNIVLWDMWLMFNFCLSSSASWICSNRSYGAGVKKPKFIFVNHSIDWFQKMQRPIIKKLVLHVFDYLLFWILEAKHYTFTLLKDAVNYLYKCHTLEVSKHTYWKNPEVVFSIEECPNLNYLIRQTLYNNLF